MKMILVGALTLALVSAPAFANQNSNSSAKRGGKNNDGPTHVNHKKRRHKSVKPDKKDSNTASTEATSGWKEGGR
jgi:hypothetical protein